MTIPRTYTDADTRPAERNCLLCSRPFLSAGAHNRVCSICREEHKSWRAA